MKPHSLIICFLLFAVTYSVYGQKLSETNFGIGFNKTSSSEYKHHWSDESTPPTFLDIKAIKSWYRNNRKISLQKEAGLNLQYAKIDLGGGGLAANNYYSGKIISLFAEASLQIRFRVDSMISFGIGPTAEYLLIGSNDLNNSYYTRFTNPPSSGDISISGINRDYFNQPSYGIKLSIFNSDVSKKNKLGLNFGYLWTKSESSNFFATNYLRISVVIGFHKNNSKENDHIEFPGGNSYQ